MTQALTSVQPSNATDLIDSFGVVLTEQWTAFPLEEEGFQRFQADTLESLQQREEWTKPDERKLQLVLAKARRELTVGQAQFAAFFADVTEVENDETAEILLASMTFSVHTRRDLKTELTLTPAMLFAAFANESHTRGNIRHSNIEKPRFTDLPVGRAVHLRRLYESSAALPRFDPFFSETFVVPIGEQGEACGITNFTTTNLEHSRSFSKVFNQIAQSITLFTAAAPTVFNTAPTSRA